MITLIEIPKPKDGQSIEDYKLELLTMESSLRGCIDKAIEAAEKKSSGWSITSDDLYAELICYSTEFLEFLLPVSSNRLRLMFINQIHAQIRLLGKRKKASIHFNFPFQHEHLLRETCFMDENANVYFDTYEKAQKLFGESIFKRKEHGVETKLHIDRLGLDVLMRIADLLDAEIFNTCSDLKTRRYNADLMVSRFRKQEQSNM